MPLEIADRLANGWKWQMNEYDSLSPSLRSIIHRLEQVLVDIHSTPGDCRDRFITEVSELAKKQANAVLQIFLNHEDAEVRCIAAHAALRTDSENGVPMALELLDDSDSVVRWEVSGLLHDFGDFRAVPSLIQVLLHDTAADVRMTAAYALGQVGDVSALDALHHAQRTDFGEDDEGRTVSESATRAIEEITTRLSNPEQA